MKLRQAILVLSMVPFAGSLSELASSQTQFVELEAAPASASLATTGHVPSYTRPTARQRAGNYGLLTFGPLPTAETAASAGIDQFDSSPPEWKQGAEGFGKRFASDFGIATVATTTRYALSEVFREDSLYYRCECTGVFARTAHAAVSAVTARRGTDGHRAFSLSALVAPYAGSTAAVYGWYPGRFGMKDAFRMGNYGLLTTTGGDVVIEFFSKIPHSLFHRRHEHDGYSSPDTGLKQ
jgi:hypothetical protein